MAALRRLASLPPGRLEQIEKLEQLRALENGMEIRVALAVERPLADVNTAADLERAERALLCAAMSAMNAALTALHVYPVKSCRGIALDARALHATGLADDRHWMLVRPNGRFVTQRELPRLALIGTAVDAGALTLDAPGMPPLDGVARDGSASARGDGVEICRARHRLRRRGRGLGALDSSRLRCGWCASMPSAPRVCSPEWTPGTRARHRIQRWLSDPRDLARLAGGAQFALAESAAHGALPAERGHRWRRRL